LTRRCGAVWPGRPSPTRLLALALFFVLSVSAGLPREHISEHYLLGPNLGAALIVAVGWGGLLALGRAARADLSARQIPGNPEGSKPPSPPL
jgi:hypothetical protein